MTPSKPEDQEGHLSQEQEEALRKRGLRDVSARTSAGVFAYGLGWLLVAQGGDFFQAHRAFVLWHFAGLMAIAAVRFVLHRRLRALLDRNLPRTLAVFRTLVVCQGLYWGILLAVGMTWDEAREVRPFLMPMSIALLVAGTMIMSIEPVLRMVFPLSVVGPAMLGLLFDFDATSAVFTVAGLGFVLYAWAVSRVLAQDYWGAQRARYLLENRARELELVSLTDALTQIPNRLMLDRRLPVEWLNARRARQPLAVALVDLDHFKRINDTHGHPFGDRCLRAAASALTADLHRPSDVVARYGGEEFIVLMPQTDEAGALAVAQRLRERVAAIALVHEGVPVALTCSIGVSATVPRTAEGAAALVQRADEALYLAKSQGRNRVAVLPQ